MLNALHTQVFNNLLATYGFTLQEDDTYTADIDGVDVVVEYYAEGQYPNFIYIMDGEDATEELTWTKVSQLMDYLEYFNP